MKRIAILVLIVICFILGYKSAGIQLDPPKPCEVVEKYEQAGRCYILTWVEVDPMDYIGLDIGDEFFIKE